MDVVDLPTFARSWTVQAPALAWLLGAGTSASAGVPTAGQVVDDLLVRLYASSFGVVRQDLDESDPAVMDRIHAHFRTIAGLPQLGSPGDYSAVLEAVMPDDGARRAYLRQMLDGRSPSYGQRVLGAFLVEGKTRLVMTTNFDQLVEGAASDARTHAGAGAPLLAVASLGSTDRAARAVSDSTWPLLVKLHGDFQESRLKNLDRELQEQDEVLRQTVVDASRQFGLVVAGYSGRDESVMAMLSDAAGEPRGWPHGIWWLTREPHALPDSVTDFLAHAARGGAAAHVVQVENFDEAMGALAAQVSLAAPVRTYVNGLRPRGVLSPAPAPSGNAPRFPVLRLNALPVVAAPTKAWSVPAGQGLTSEVFRARLRAARWRGAAVLGPGEVLALGRASALTTALDLETAPEPVDIVVLEPDAPAHVRALALEALTRGLARRCGARAVVGERGTPRLVVPARREDEPERARQCRALVQSAYTESVAGRLATSLGRNRDGQGRSFAEGVRLRLEFAFDSWWLQFTPFTWVERDPTAGEGGRNRSADPAAAWIRERWARRKRNEAWAAIIDTWASVLAGVDDGHPQTTRVWALRRADAAEPDALGGLFELGTKTAWSKEVRA
ncbi:SIR2 family protein [Georgenia sp. TF02-10]|uniref:SIR2 family protein n=1 Tax=Georgenia sp. TF02-10 TaxID=2917725 RepID=UPI001FA801F9|nr:SIR2 family protein [Georgenia sp. TF02-10]UNX53999.1 SIR2 family protein [Georgenia sp. TF02-10]